jgi:pimeloyl-ACP methyl ester carboxylesterase
MPVLTTDDGVKLHYDEAGSGLPVVFVHEVAGDHRSWEPQLRHFARRYRCIAYNARGYPPSDVPDDVESYRQEQQADDAAAVLDHLKIERAHVVGLSMGGFATLHFGLRHPRRAVSLVTAGIGSGAPKDMRERFQSDSIAAAARFEREGSKVVAEAMAVGPARVQLQTKDPRGWEEEKRYLAEHSAKGAALTLRGYPATRPSIYYLEAPFAALTIPTLIVAGDEDEPCLDASLWLKRRMPYSGIAILPKTGHCVNLEEPDAFNRLVLDFLTTVEQGKWGKRDPRTLVTAPFGQEKK